MVFRSSTGTHSSPQPGHAPCSGRSVTRPHLSTEATSNLRQSARLAPQVPANDVVRAGHAASIGAGSGAALYAGAVTHARTRPRPHRLSYRVFCLLLDLDAPETPRLRLFGRNRRAIVSFHDRDHGDGGDNLADWVRTRLSEAGVAARPGETIRIEALCYPRIFGYVFNPLTVFFCWRPDGALAAVLYEVSNTQGEKHTYVIAASPGDVDAQTGRIRQRCAKQFYVSPFIAMDCIYNFRIDPPGDRVRLGIVEEDADGVLLTAVFAGERRALTDRALAWALLAHPLMTLKITFGIYWEAARLLLKRTPVHRHTAAAQTIGYTIVDPATDRS